MGLMLQNGSYKGRTTSLYSKDGKTWYEDRDYKTPADMTRYRTDDGGAFQFLIIGVIILAALFYKLFIQ
jgi:hypothetical protein